MAATSARRPFTGEPSISAASLFAASLREDRDRSDARRFVRGHSAWQGEFRGTVHSWKQGGITGYTGHCPHWLRDKHLMQLKRELGKMYPPFFP